MKRAIPKKYIGVSISVGIIGTCFGGWYMLFQRAFTPIYKEPIIIEYGQEKITKKDILEEVEENKKIDIVQLPDINSKEIQEEQDITITLQKGLRKQEETVPIQIKDTKPPIINVADSDIDITKGDDTKTAEDNIIEIKDLIDGPIENIQRGSLQECTMFIRNRMFKSDCVYIGTNFDVNISGDYEVKIASYDKNGNSTIHSYFIHVKEDNARNRTVSFEEPFVLNETESLYHNTLDEDYLPIDLILNSNKIYETKEEAQEAFNEALQQGVFMHLQTVTGIRDNHGISHNYYVLLPNETKLDILSVEGEDQINNTITRE